jgi:hypothetical protein
MTSPIRSAIDFYDPPHDLGVDHARNTKVLGFGLIRMRLLRHNVRWNGIQGALLENIDTG